MHPTAVMFLFLSAMLMIPNYPFYVICFYTSLGLFFICLTGRENRDIEYTLLLPIAKRQLVYARILLAVILEMAQLAAAVPFAILRGCLPIPPNVVGIEANTAFFGSAFALYGLFNLIFFTAYYRAPDHVGRAFIGASAAQAVYMLLAETAVHAIPFAKAVLDTPDPANMGAKLPVLAAGIVIFAVLTWIAAKRAVKSFETLDL